MRTTEERRVVDECCQYNVSDGRKIREDLSTSSIKNGVVNSLSVNHEVLLHNDLSHLLGVRRRIVWIVVTNCVD